MKRAAIYLRMSTDKKEQEDSPESQRAEIHPYCQKQGYTIVGEYLDSGISGGKFEHRPELQRLIQDAIARKFDIIVVDKRDRLDRQDPEEWNQNMVPWLRKSRMILDSVIEGLTDYSKKDFSTFLKDGITSHVNSQFLVNHAANVLRGSKMAAAQGKNLGLIPYGYRSVPDDPNDPTSSRHLEIFEQEAEIVRWIFNSYDSGNYALQAIVDKLNADCVPCPRIAHHKPHHKPLRHQPRWQKSTIKGILTNPKYTGLAIWGQTAKGDYGRIIYGERRMDDFKGAKYTRNDVPITCPNAHKAIVSQEFFDRVQARLAGNQRAGKSAVGEHLLSRLVYCGPCGKSMHAKVKKGNVYYQCRKRPEGCHPACDYRSISEDRILYCIRQRLKSGDFKQEVVDQHIAELTRQEQERKANSPDRQPRIEKLKQQIQTANRMLMRLDEDQMADAQREIQEMKAELQTLELAEKSDSDAVQAFNNAIKEIRAAIDAYRLLINTLPTDDKDTENLDGFLIHEEFVNHLFAEGNFPPKSLDGFAQSLADEYRHISNKKRIDRELNSTEATVTPEQHRAALMKWVKRIVIYWTDGESTPRKMDNGETRRYTKHEVDEFRCTIETHCGDNAKLFNRVLTKPRTP